MTTSRERTLVKRFIRTSTLILAITFLLGASSNSFALPPKKKALVNPACDKVSGPDIVYAKQRFVMNECQDRPEPVEGAIGIEGGGGGGFEGDYLEVKTCNHPDKFNSDPSCWG